MKKYFILLVLVLCSTVSSQTFKSYGLSIGYTFAENGWNHPDTSSYYYHNKAYISSIHFGFFGEFLNKKNFSTFAGLTLKIRHYSFEYDLGNIPDPAIFSNSISILSMDIHEKIRFDITDRFNIYLFGGFKGDYIFSRNIQKDFQSEFADMKSFSPGTTVGIGFAKRLDRFWRVSFDFYYNHDLTDLYKSTTGYIRNNEFGMRFGIGPFNPATK